MAVPIQGQRFGYKDAYNYIFFNQGYLLNSPVQVGPLMFNVKKVKTLIVTLCSITIFCIDCGGNIFVIIKIDNAHHITCKFNASTYNSVDI